MEATCNWAYLYESLEDLADEILLAHPLKVKAIASARIKTDKIDAGILAHLGRVDLVPCAWVPPRPVRDLREVLRHRAFLVALRTRLKNRIHATLTKLGIEHSFSDLFGKRGRQWLKTLQIREPFRQIIDQDMRVIEALDDEILKLSQDIRARAEITQEAKLLMTIYGIGEYSALLILAEIGEISRFPTPKHLVSYAGLCPSTYQSGGIDRHGRITKQGSRWLRWILIEATQKWAKRPGRLGDYYRRIAKKKGIKTARVALAREILTAIFWMLKKGEVFRDCGGPAHPQILLGS